MLRAFLLGVGTLLLPHSSFAQTPAAPSAAEAAAKRVPKVDSLDDFDAVCGKVMRKAGSLGSKGDDPSAYDKAGINSQKVSYCKAAESSKEAAEASGAAWKVWAAVTGVCTAACATSLAGALAIDVTQYTCLGVSIAGAVTDAVITKEYMGALTGILGAGMGFAMNQMNAPVETATTAATEGSAKKAGQKDWGSCIAAASALLSTVTKHGTASASEKTAIQSIKSAAALSDTPDAVAGNAGVMSPTLEVTSGAGTGEVGSGGGGGGSQSGFATSTGGTGGTGRGPCTGASSGTAILSCATSTDPQLPGFTRSPKFQQEFEKRTQKGLGSFLESASSPRQALAAAMGPSVPRSGAERLAALIQKADSEFAGAHVASAVAVVGGGNAGSMGGEADSGMPDMGALMEGLMGALNPDGSKKQGAPSDPSVVHFDSVLKAIRRNGPSSLLEDRSVSLFDRVSFRYYWLNRRDGFGVAQGPNPSGGKTR